MLLVRETFFESIRAKAQALKNKRGGEMSGRTMAEDEVEKVDEVGVVPEESFGKTPL